MPLNVEHDEIISESLRPVNVKTVHTLTLTLMLPLWDRQPLMSCPLPTLEFHWIPVWGPEPSAANQSPPKKNTDIDFYQGGWVGAGVGRSVAEVIQSGESNELWPNVLTT